jgi:hypothetical protein
MFIKKAVTTTPTARLPLQTWGNNEALTLMLG